MKLSTRNKVIIVTALVTIFYYSFTLYKIFIANRGMSQLIDIVSVVTIFITMFFGVYFVVEFKVKYFRIFTILLFPALFISVVVYFIELALIQKIFRLSGYVLSSLIGLALIMLTYFSILNANILNISSLASLPLERAAKSVQYVFTLIFSYICILVIFSVPILIWFKILLLILLFIFISYQTFWVLSLPISDLHRISILNSIILISSIPIILIWPLSAQFIALIYSAILYVLFGKGLEKNERKDFIFPLEYVVVILLVFIFCLVSATWGIEGRILM